MSEQELIQRCINNDRQSQETLYRLHADKMYNVCLTYAKDQDEACDILQEGFIKIFKNLKSFNFNGSFEGWIRRIIINTTLVFYHKRKKERDDIENYRYQKEPAADNILEKINAEDLIEMVNELPDKAAMVLKLFAIEGHEHKEIAKLMGITEGTSKSQLNRARYLLKEAIAKHEGRLKKYSQQNNEGHLRYFIKGPEEIHFLQ